MKPNKNKHIIFPVFGILIFFLSQMPSFAQPHPPRPIQVFTVKDINFGAFVQGISGGTLIIYPNGSRSTTGDILQVNLGYMFYPAIFEIDVLPGTIINHFHKVTDGRDILCP